VLVNEIKIICPVINIASLSLIHKKEGKKPREIRLFYVVEVVDFVVLVAIVCVSEATVVRCRLMIPSPYSSTGDKPSSEDSFS
jgi:hypothetical protein